MRPYCLLLMLLAGSLATPVQAQQGGAAQPVPTLAPHQALYALRAVKPEGASLRGSISIEMNRDCEVWDVKFIQDVQARDADGGDWRYRQREHYRETLSGLAMGFRVEKDTNGAQEIVTGRGAFETREVPGSYEVFREDAAEPETGELPVNTLFAATSPRIILRELKAGSKSFGIAYFDAVNDFRPKVQQVNLLRDDVDLSSLPLGNNPLLAGDAWLIRVTEVHNEQAVNANMLLHESGVVSIMGLQMGELVVQAELSLLNPISPPAC